MSISMALIKLCTECAFLDCNLVFNMINITYQINNRNRKNLTMIDQWSFYSFFMIFARILKNCHSTGLLLFRWRLRVRSSHIAYICIGHTVFTVIGAFLLVYCVCFRTPDTGQVVKKICNYCITSTANDNYHDRLLSDFETIIADLRPYTRTSDNSACTHPSFGPHIAQSDHRLIT